MKLISLVYMIGVLPLISLIGGVSAAEPCPVRRAGSIHSTAEAEALAVQAAEKYKLAATTLACVSHKASDDGVEQGFSGKYVVSFYEIHDEKCPGDPNTSPRLFTVIVDDDGDLQTDAYGNDLIRGQFRPIRCKRR